MIRCAFSLIERHHYGYLVPWSARWAVHLHVLAHKTGAAKLLSKGLGAHFPRFNLCDSIHSTMLHHGMIIVGLPYTERGLLDTACPHGGSPLGTTSLAGSDGTRMPSETELRLCFAQGKRVAAISKRLCA